MVTSYYVYREKKYRYTTSLSSATDEPYSEFEGKSPSIYGRIEVSDEIALGEVFSGDEDVPDLSKRYIKMLMDAPRQFSVQKDLNRQLIEIVGRLVEQMEGVERSAVLLVDEASGFLDLRAHHPENDPAVSGTLAVRALDEKKGFIWQKSSLDNASDSIRQMRINSGMYAPLICGEHHLGVLCVDTTRRDHVYKRLDLHFFLAFTQIIAACVQSKVIHETVSLNLQGIQEALKDAEKSGATQLIRTVQNYAKFLQSKI
jgi:transcriptional regulator with GAF, ATPase, and Fis domain